MKRVEGQMGLFDQDMPYGKMSQVHSAVTKGKTSELSSKSFAKSKMKEPLFLDLRGVGGTLAGTSWVTGIPLHGESSMRAFGEYPSVVEESGLSQILEEEVPLKYFLSAEACRGVLRRAEKRGKALPGILETALNQQIERWEKFGTPLPLNVLIEEHAQRKAEGVDLYNQQTTGNVSKTLTAVVSDADHVPCVICYCFDGEQVTSPTHLEKNVRDVCHTLSRTGAGRVYCVYDARGNGDGETVNTMTGDHNNRNTVDKHGVCYAVGNGQVGQIGLSECARTLNCMHDQQAVLISKTMRVRCGKEGGEKGPLIQDDPTGTLGCNNDQILFQVFSPIYIVRRLTPLECCRLQGMPDWWIDGTNGSDAAQYKMWGNGMALPNALYVMEGFAEIEENSNETSKN